MADAQPGGDGRWAFLKVDSSIIWSTAFENQPNGEHGVIFVEYSDIYGREILSGWAYQIAGTGANAVLVAGEPLYPVLRDKRNKNSVISVTLSANTGYTD